MTDEAITPGQLVPVTAPATEVAPYIVSDETKEAARHSKAPGTVENYRKHLKNYLAFCEARGVAPWPLEPLVIADWCTHRAHHGTPRARRKQAGKTGNAVVSVRAGVAALKFWCEDVRGDVWPANMRPVKMVLAGLARTRAEAPEQAEPMTGELLSAILAGFRETHPGDIRDAALMALGYSLGRRRSEIVGLDLERLGSGDGILKRTPKSLEVHLIRHKTMATGGEPAVFVMPIEGSELAVEAIDRWITTAGIVEGDAVFRAVDWRGAIKAERLGASAVGEAIKRRVRAYFLGLGQPAVVAEREARKFSGHSMRVGLAVSAADAGADIRQIQAALGHATPAMSSRYAKKADQSRNSVLRLGGVALAKKPIVDGGDQGEAA